MSKHNTAISNILVIGCGGSGLRAAIEAKLQGLSVSVLGKRPRNDSHTVLAAGGINAAFGNLDPQDSWEMHFADTYIEGYGIADSDIIEILAKNSSNAVEEVDSWGANLQKLNNGKFDQRFFGAHTYRRTCYSGDYTGLSILNALLNKANSLEIPIFDSQYVSELLVNDNNCFGAMTFDISNGQRTVFLADAVILCTGGHTRIWKKSSSRKEENTGDGYFLALKAGCELIDMEMVQFHPTGMLFPEEIAGTLVTEAVRGEGGKLFNSKGFRFMVNYDKERMELSTRDKVAIANYTEIIEGRGTENGGVLLDISHKDKDFILEKIPKIYKQFLEYQMLDISKQPMEVAPTAHYSMGGIKVNSLEHKTSVNGLYAAGEVAGGLHGANRLGGNSLAEILVFGKLAGKAAAEYSKKLAVLETSHDHIKKAHIQLDRFFKNGNQLALNLQNDLQNLMWKFCGVVKNKESLEMSLNKVKELKILFKDIDVVILDGNYKNLVRALDLEASLLSAEATIRSCLEREESRGSHQRSDFKNICQKKYNIHVRLKDNEILLKKVPAKPLRKGLELIIRNTTKISNFEKKLLE